MKLSGRLVIVSVSLEAIQTCRGESNVSWPIRPAWTM